MAREGGRSAKRQSRRNSFSQAPAAQHERIFAPITIIDDAQVEAIHQASLEILRDTGVHFMGAKARAFLAGRPGVSVDAETQVVRFDPAMVEEAIASAPRSFKIHARNPARSLAFDGRHLAFANVVTPPYLEDAERGQRSGTMADMEELLKLCQSLNAVDMLYGYPVEPQDIDPETRHLDAYRAHILLTDKPWRGYTLGDDRILDAIEMARIARGIDLDALQAEPSFLANVTTNSPLRIDEPMGDGLMIMARAMQPVSITSFCMAGGIAPITLAGALAQQNAEILAAIVLSQLTRPGAPVIYGAFSTTIHMRSGAIAFGNPEFAQLTIASGQLARRYGVPFKAAVTTGSKIVDAQAAYETQFSLWAAVASGADVIAHAAGFLESALTVNYEKLIIDAEMIQMIGAMMKPIEFTKADFATDTIRAVGPGGHFFATPHTMARYETAFYEPMISDWENRQNWVERGAKTAPERATEIWKALLEKYEQPPIDPAIRDELDAYVARRREEIISKAA